MTSVHSTKAPFACPNAPNCLKVKFFYLLLCCISLRNVQMIIYLCFQRFKSKGNCKLHFAICRAEKPALVKREADEDESVNDSSAFAQTGRSHSDSSADFTIKECVVLIQRKGYIDKAAKEGFTTMTCTRYVKNGKKTGASYWQIIA